MTAMTILPLFGFQAAEPNFSVALRLSSQLDCQVHQCVTRAEGRISVAGLEASADGLNPIARIEVLAMARVPAAIIHGDVDKVVPPGENSVEFVRRYQEAGVESLVKLILIEGLGIDVMR